MKHFTLFILFSLLLFSALPAQADAVIFLINGKAANGIHTFTVNGGEEYPGKI